MHLLGLALVAWEISRAHADPVVVHTSGPLPFSKRELESALALRAAHANARVEVDVVADAAAVRIEFDGRRRHVTLDGARGGDAARLVAFAILDLAADRLVPPDAPVPAEQPPTRVPSAPPGGHRVAPPAPVIADRPARRALVADRPAAEVIAAPGGAPVAARRTPPWSLAVWGTTGSHEAVALDGSVALKGPLRAFASLGVEPETTAPMFARRGFPMRAGAAWRRGWLELRAGGTAVLERAAAERTATEVALGGGAALVVIAPRTIAGFGLVIGAGGDGYTRTIAYRVHGMPVVEGAQLAWWAGVGLVREGRR